MKQAETPVSEYVKIRRYVTTLIYRAGSKSVRIPTLTELAAMFDVSRPTVIKALKELTNDGYIIARPHLGSFTNPAKSLEPQGMAIMPVVGVLHTDGMLTHYTPYFAEQLAYLLLECARMQVVVHQLQLNSRQPEQILRSIEAEALDVLIWLQPSHSLTGELRRRGLKVITSALPEGTPWNVFQNFYQAGYEIGKRCLKQGLHTPLLYYGSPEIQEISGFVQAYREAGIVLDDRNFVPEGDCFEYLESRFAGKEPPDTLFFVTTNHEPFLRKLEAIKPDYRETLFLILPNVTGRGAGRGMTYLYPLKKNAAALAGLIRAQLNDEQPASGTGVTIPVEIREIT